MKTHNETVLHEKDVLVNIFGEEAVVTSEANGETTVEFNGGKFRVFRNYDRAITYLYRCGYYF